MLVRCGRTACSCPRPCRVRARAAPVPGPRPCRARAGSVPVSVPVSGSVPGSAPGSGSVSVERLTLAAGGECRFETGGGLGEECVRAGGREQGDPVRAPGGGEAGRDGEGAQVE